MIDTTEKLSGILIPVFALRREGDLGIGDTAAVMEAIDFCQRINSGVLQVLPINETGGDNSPYNAISSVALDPVLLTMQPDMVPGLSDERLRALTASQVESLAAADAVAYPKVKQLKLDLLAAAFDAFVQSATAQQKEDFACFKKEEAGWLDDYTLFRTLIEVNNDNTAWTRWIPEQRSPKAARDWLKQQPDAAKLSRRREFYAYVQWVAFAQWLGVRAYADNLKVELMGDIPFGVSRFSADVWANQPLFDLDWSGGAPPETWFKDDPFTAKWGQNWGLPLYLWDAHKKQGYAWWHQRIEKTTKIFHYFRIDHVLGFFRVYAFPWEPERNGEFLDLTEEQAEKKTGGRLPHFIPRSDELPADAKKNASEGKALLQMILAAAGEAGVVAEDLGMVPDYVRPLLQRLGIPGFTIPYWEHTEDMELKPSDTLPQVSLATWATHDHMPLVLFYEDLVRRWHGDDGHEGWLEVQRLMRFLGLDENNPPDQYTPELHHAFVKALLETPCWLAVFMITDLLGTVERFNQPGTSGESNWSRRMEKPLSWYEKTQPYQGRISDFSRLVKETRRLPQLSQVGTIR